MGERYRDTLHSQKKCVLMVRVRKVLWRNNERTEQLDKSCKCKLTVLYQENLKTHAVFAALRIV